MNKDLKRVGDFSSYRGKVVMLVIAIILSFTMSSVLNWYIVSDDTYLHVNGYKVSRAEYDYYYTKNKNRYNEVELYLSNLSQVLDGEDDISEENYVKLKTIDDLVEKYILFDLMNNEGYKVPNIDNLKSVIEKEITQKHSNKNITVDQSIKSKYGDKLNKRNLSEYILDDRILSEYKSVKLENNEDVYELYKDKSDYYETVKYLEFKTKGQINVESITDMYDMIFDKDSFLEIVGEVNEGSQEDDYLNYAHGKLSVHSKEKADWLFSPDREKESLALMKNPDGTFSILMFLDRYADKTPTYSFRVINILNNDNSGEIAAEVIDNYKSSGSLESKFKDLTRIYDMSINNNTFFNEVSEEDILTDYDVMKFIKTASPGEIKSIELDNGHAVVLFISKDTPRWRSLMNRKYEIDREIEFYSKAMKTLNLEYPTYRTIPASHQDFKDLYSYIDKFSFFNNLEREDV